MPKVMFGAWQPDVASIDMENTSYVHNVLPSASGYGPFKQLTAFAESLPSRCLGMFGVLDDDNSSHVFAGTATKLYKLNSTTRAWEDVTRASGGDYTVGDRDFWSFALFGQNVVAVTNSNAPQVFDLSSSTDFAALGGSPPQARYVSVVGDFLVLAGLTANPNRIQWSALNDITGWTVGTNSSDYQDFPDGGYTVGLTGGEFGLVFQQNAVRRMVFNPVSSTVFDFSRISENRGLFMPYSLVKAHQAAFFYSSDGFFRIDITGAVTPIGENRVDQTFRRECDLSNSKFMVGASDPQSTKIYWAYKTNGSANTTILDKVLIYDWLRNQWTQATFDVEYLSQSSPLTATLESLDAVADLDALPYSLDYYQTTPEIRLIGVGSDHAPGYFDGDALEAVLDLPEAAIGGETRMFIRNVAPVSDAPSAYVRVGKREALNASITYSSETAISARGYAPQRVTGRFMTSRLRIPAGTNWTYARGLDVDAIQAGLR